MCITGDLTFPEMCIMYTSLQCSINTKIYLSFLVINSALLILASIRFQILRIRTTKQRTNVDRFYFVDLSPRSRAGNTIRHVLRVYKLITESLHAIFAPNHVTFLRGHVALRERLIARQMRHMLDRMRARG